MLPLLHNSTFKNISIGMGLFRLVKRGCQDLWDKLCNHKWRSIICALVAIAGIVVGVVLLKVFRYGWWYNNRCDYALRLFEGGFSLFFFFLLWTAVFYLCVVGCSVVPQTKFLLYTLLFVACLYCGANTAAAIVCWSVWGVLYTILVTLFEVVGYYLATLVACCEPTSCRNFKESLCDTKQSLAVLAVAFFVKIICYFVILRILTAVI